MRVVVTERIKELAENYFRVIEESNEKKNDEDIVISSTSSNLEELKKDLTKGSLSTASYKLLVQFSQSTNQTPIFTSMNQIKIEAKEETLPETSVEVSKVHIHL